MNKNTARITAALLSLLTAAGLVSCGDTAGDTDTQTTPVVTEAVTTAETVPADSLAGVGHCPAAGI